MASCSNFNILVVDDDIFVRNMIQERLNMEGYTVTTAENGEVGWKKFSENTYQLIITDIVMPKLSGIELLSKILATNMKVPTVVMSGGLSKALEKLLKATGAHTFLSKPFSGKELLEVVRAKINLRK